MPIGCMWINRWNHAHRPTRYSRAKELGKKIRLSVSIYVYHSCIRMAIEIAQDANFTTLAIIVFLMQAGFAFLEAGSVQSKNTTNILFKNFISSICSFLACWACGHMFAFGGGNAFIGNKHFFLAAVGRHSEELVDWFIYYVYTITAATIIDNILRAFIFSVVLLATTNAGQNIVNGTSCHPCGFRGCFNHDLTKCCLPCYCQQPTPRHWGVCAYPTPVSPMDGNP
ncbi:uncharacterized protein LOC134193537 [Corticium candelabrum]|uniref:uncharacterized protein LOC134193537 n=1 Tax=Corticium candelabrum TaxID=121492 RepID=UPI002E269806|nr:uncharacterized protein LOC134193537 [Corticium candelabrum]